MAAVCASAASGFAAAPPSVLLDALVRSAGSGRGRASRPPSSSRSQTTTPWETGTIEVMKRRTLVAHAVSLALVTTAVWAGWAGVAQQASARSNTSAGVYTVNEVLRAFTKAGVGLYDTEYDFPGLGGSVAELATVRPHQGWNVAVYVYPRSSEAAASFRTDAGEWHASGMAAVELKNLVVTVVPKGRLVGRKAPPFPMPQLVVKALAVFSPGKS